MQLKVIKSDGSIEEYMHTKVIGTFSNALALVDEPNVFAAEQLAEAVTYHLYKRNHTNTVTSDEVHLMVQAVLNATGFENASESLNDYRLNRNVRRRRIEIIENCIDSIEHSQGDIYSWHKSKIVKELVKNRGLNKNIARAVAAAVEEKVLNINMTRIPQTLLQEMVLHDTQAMINAQQQLQEAVVAY